MEEIGTVISFQNTPNTQEFWFVLKKGTNIPKGAYVSCSLENKRLLARVDDIVKTNRYFMQAEAVDSYEEPLDTHFPTDLWEYTVAYATCLGIVDDNKRIFRPFSPASPGSPVFLARKEDLQALFKLDENGLYLGKFLGLDVDVKINLSKLFQKHLAILSITGAGKSHTTCVLIEELLKRELEQGQVSAIVVDVHGEYLSFMYDENFSGKTFVYYGKDIRIGLPSLSSHYLSLFLPNLTFAQKRELKKAISDLKKKQEIFGMKELMQEIENSESIKPSTKEALLANLEQLRNLGLFGYYDNPNPKNLALQGKLSILDLSDLIDNTKRQMILAYFANELFNLRRQKKVPPFILFIEEAHNFAPEKASKEEAISSFIIKKIAREGRKFNSSLCLISQRPVNLSTTALSQCNTQIYLRIVNPYDIDHIAKSSEGLTSDLKKMLPSLQVGEAIIVGEATTYPLLVKIRDKEVKLVEKHKSMEEEAIEYANATDQMKDDVKAFMEN